MKGKGIKYFENCASVELQLTRIDYRALIFVVLCLIFPFVLSCLELSKMQVQINQDLLRPGRMQQRNRPFGPSIQCWPIPPPTLYHSARHSGTIQSSQLISQTTDLWGVGGNQSTWWKSMRSQGKHANIIQTASKVTLEL